MKYLKTINELFDDIEIRNRFGKEYLSGDLSPESTLDWDEYKADPLLTELLEKVTYLNSLKSKRLDKGLYFSFSEERDGLLLYFEVQVTEFANNRYILNIIAASSINDKMDWEEDLVKNIRSKEELFNKLNTTGFNMIKKFNDYCEKEFDISIIDNRISGNVDLN